MTTEAVTLSLIINCGHGNEVLGANAGFFPQPPKHILFEK